jgi:oxalate decarboxylase/phosphoglucose isomerase-like protein (cupin superfamily)
MKVLNIRGHALPKHSESPTHICSFLQLQEVIIQPSPYIERFSKKPWQKFPGGQYKASTSTSLTASTISGALFQLNPGGLRELHWHDVDEWAFVLRGSCR